MLATLIDSYTTKREEFQLTKGYQPANSLFYLKSGAFSCEINGQSYILHTGDVAIFDRETLMRRHVLEPICFLYIKFNSSDSSLFPVQSGVFSKLSGRAVENLEKIESLSRVHTAISLQLRTHYFNDLLLQLLEKPEQEQAEDADELLPSTLDAPIAFLRQNLTAKLQVEEVARYAGMSVSALESKFRKLTNDSVYNYLIRLRMEHAKRLLTETTYSVTDIAAQCGYENLFYFCSAFKKNTGVTPTAYRRANLI